MNAALKGLYERHWSALASCIPRGEHYSAPLLVHVGDDYADAGVRLMIVGQQTNTWWGADGWDKLPLDAPIEHLLKCYIGFQLGKGYPGPFWSAARSLVKLLEASGKRCGLSGRTSSGWTERARKTFATHERSRLRKPCGRSRYWKRRSDFSRLTSWSSSPDRSTTGSWSPRSREPRWKPARSAERSR